MKRIHEAPPLTESIPCRAAESPPEPRDRPKCDGIDDERHDRQAPIEQKAQTQERNDLDTVAQRTAHPVGSQSSHGLYIIHETANQLATTQGVDSIGARREQHSVQLGSQVDVYPLRQANHAHRMPMKRKAFGNGHHHDDHGQRCAEFADRRGGRKIASDPHRPDEVISAKDGPERRAGEGTICSRTQSEKK